MECAYLEEEVDGRADFRWLLATVKTPHQFPGHFAALRRYANQKPMQRCQKERLTKADQAAAAAAPFL